MGSGLDKEQHARTSSYVPRLHDVEFDCAAILRDRFFDDRHSGHVHGIFVLQPVLGDAGGIQRDETGEISSGRLRWRRASLQLVNSVILLDSRLGRSKASLYVSLSSSSISPDRVDCLIGTIRAVQ